MSDSAAFLACLLLACFGLGWLAHGETPEAAYWREQARTWQRVAENWRDAAQRDSRARKEKVSHEGK